MCTVLAYGPVISVLILVFGKSMRRMFENLSGSIRRANHRESVIIDLICEFLGCPSA